MIPASNDLVVGVTFNHRVGPYGFITNGNAAVPNKGLRDQRKALVMGAKTYLSLAAISNM